MRCCGQRSTPTSGSCSIRRGLLLAAYVVLFWLLLPVALMGSALLLDRWLGWQIPPAWFWTVAGALLAVGSGILLGAAIIQFRHFGRVMPVSALPPDRLIQAGLYALWRHPIYLFFTLFFVGVGLLIRSPSLLVIVTPVFIAAEAGYVAIEERALARRFGSAWRNYRLRTPLLFPRRGFILYPLFRLACWLLFDFRIRGRENLPLRPPFFVIAAHRNYIDPILIGAAAVYPVHFITTFEMFRRPLLCALLRPFLCIPKKRYLHDVGAARAIAARLAEGAVIGIFPEGERSWTGRTQPWKPEVLNLLRHYSAVPVVPVRLSGNYLAWPRWGSNLRRAPIEVAIGAPVLIKPEADAGELERHLRSLIEPDDSGRRCLSRNVSRDITKVVYRCPVCRSFRRVDVVRSAEFACPDCHRSFTVSPNYSIKWSEEGAVLEMPLAAVYDRIRIKADDLVGKDGIVAASEAAQLWEESGTELKPVLAGRLTLGRRALRIDGPAGARVIDLAAVRSVTTESNRKLQLYDSAADRLYQLTFPGESVLKWQDLIVAVLRCELGVEPNTR
jgi:1-acyl-sn-glycerol-3-phosphate acyltransferase